MNENRKCPYCNKEVNGTQLYVLDKKLIYHYSCYNLKITEKEEDNE